MENCQCETHSLEMDENGFPSLLSTAKSALEITSQNWNSIGLKGVSPSAVSTRDSNNVRDRVFSILIIRVLAIVCQRADERDGKESKDICEGPDDVHPKSISKFSFADNSTSTICQTIIALSENSPSTPVWPEEITPQVIQNILDYTSYIIKMYRKVSYHNAGHAYHVTCSSNKLLDMVLCEFDLVEGFEPEIIETGSGADSFRNANKKAFEDGHIYIYLTSGKKRIAKLKEKKVISSSFGIKKDTMAQFAFLFSALVHDVDHSGVNNGQLVRESDELAILYNDQSVLEQRSLAVAFSELRKLCYEPLRTVLFQPGHEDYTYFRKTVIDLVLCTDIASPERVQIMKSKWKEAFGDTEEAKKRRVEKGIKILSKSLREMAVGQPLSRNNANDLWSSLTVMNSADIFRKDETNPSESDDPTHRKHSSMSMSFLDYFHKYHNREPDECSDSQTSLSPSSSVSEFSTESDLDDPLDGVIESRITLSSNQTHRSENNQNNRKRITHNEKDDGEITTSDKRSSASTNTVSFSTGNIVSRRESEISNKSGKSIGTRSKNSRRSSGRSSFNSVDLEKPRRFTAPAMVQEKRHYYRLGIRRALDLTGRPIEDFSLQQPTSNRLINDVDYEDDECDEMKKIVVLEQMMMAADVSANMQGWDNMLKWNTRLFNEQKSCFAVGRGVDPTPGWYDGQITFFECYTLILAHRLAETGVFGSYGKSFAKNVVRNRDKWIQEGVAATSQLIYEWNRKQERRTSRQNLEILESLKDEFCAND